eukprot:scpid57596/ scgid2727/ 
MSSRYFASAGIAILLCLLIAAETCRACSGSNDCRNGGTCNSGSCTCLSIFTGATCEEFKLKGSISDVEANLEAVETTVFNLAKDEIKKAGNEGLSAAKAKLGEVEKHICGLLGEAVYEARDCKQLHDQEGDLPSGYYSLRSSGEGLRRVYCKMEGKYGGGWTRVGRIHPETHKDCPLQMEYIEVEGKAMCTRPARNNFLEPGVSGFLAPDYIPYTEISGYVKAYRQGTVDAFRDSAGKTDKQCFADGITITAGYLDTHVFTYAVGLPPVVNNMGRCPCHGGTAPPEFVGRNYTCTAMRSGNPGWQMSDHLWEDSTLCPGDDSGAWFKVAAPPGFGIERGNPIRVTPCTDEAVERIGIDDAEIYVR